MPVVHNCVFEQDLLALQRGQRREEVFAGFPPSRFEIACQHPGQHVCHLLSVLAHLERLLRQWRFPRDLITSFLHRFAEPLNILDELKLLLPCRFHNCCVQLEAVSFVKILLPKGVFNFIINLHEPLVPRAGRCGATRCASSAMSSSTVRFSPCSPGHLAALKPPPSSLQDPITALTLCRQTPTTILKVDVSKAHRRIKVLQKDWRYMTATIENQVWVNKVGPYGIASAQYHWGRMAALILRMLYHTFQQIIRALVFVDDFAIIWQFLICFMVRKNKIMGPHQALFDE